MQDTPAEVAALLTRAGMLARQERCPVCGEAAREPATRPRPRHDEYMIPLARVLGVKYEPLMQLLEVHACKRCGSIYCDPWLSARGRSSLYARALGQHQAGWDRFYAWARRENRSARPEAVIWELITRAAGEVGVYGELGCPFQGLFMYFRGLEEEAGIDRGATVAREIASLQATCMQPPSPPPSRAFAARAWRKGWRMLGRSGPQWPNRRADDPADLERELAARPSAGDGAAPPVAGSRPTAPPPRSRYLVFEASSAFWMANCVSLQCSCRALSQGVLDATVVTLEDVAREKIVFDAFAVYDTLDHFMDPMRVLRAILDVSRIVLIENHPGEPGRTFSRQHPVAIGRQFLEHVAEEGWSWVDLGNRLAPKTFQNFYLVSSKIDLGDADLEALAGSIPGDAAPLVARRR